MERKSITEPPQPNYSEQLQRDLDELLPDIEISEAGISLTVQLLDTMRQRYGDPTSETYLAYHNDEHAYDVMCRAITIAKILAEKVPDQVNDSDFELAIIASAGHDIVQRHTGGQTDEELSAEYVCGLMIEAGYSAADTGRVNHAIIATTASHDGKSVQQTHVRQGDRDPLKLIVSFADIQAMTMEGFPRMITDVARLYTEIKPPGGASIPEYTLGFAAFALTQREFAKDRLRDIQPNLEYYFDQETAVLIQQRFIEAFGSRGSALMYVTKELGRLASRPTDLARLIQKSVHSIPSTPRETARLLSNALGNIIDQFARK